MTSSRTDPRFHAALLPLLLLAACSPARLSVEPPVGRPLVTGLDAPDRWDVKQTRFWKAEAADGSLLVANTPLGTGISPVWLDRLLPRDFEAVVSASLEKEGLDGGWGLEFGARDRKYAYRVLMYASGRFCVDRLFDVYPEFIHCVPSQPEVGRGATANELSVRVQGDTISVSVNGDEVISFLDDRYEAGGFALAVAGAGTRVRFNDIAIVSLE
jgi:hypothetical protein